MELAILVTGVMLAILVVAMGAMVVMAYVLRESNKWLHSRPVHNYKALTMPPYSWLQPDGELTSSPEMTGGAMRTALKFGLSAD